jgi:aminoglycoside 6'-N-acetyltransferase
VNPDVNTTEYRITFRPLAISDMPNMSKWLSDPDVAPWYGEGGTAIEHLTKKYSPVISGEDPTLGFISQVNGVEVGYIQSYAIDSEPEYAAQLRIDAGAVGIDLFVGEAEYRGKGFGTAILKAFTREIVFGEMQASFAVIGPDPKNLRAVRSYEKAGFSYLKTVFVEDDENPHNTGEEYLMLRYP